MSLRIDGRTVRDRTCTSCGEAFRHVTGFINDAAGPYAVYFAACHGHPDREAQIDVVLGSWGYDPPIQDHLTFSCRLRPDGASLGDAPLASSSDSGTLGRRLSREDALDHPRVGDFWTVIDLLAESDESINQTVYGGPADHGAAAT